ncbi:MAG: hypothetical protein ACYTG6_16395, partial [Planctomycetota bacterium]
FERFLVRVRMALEALPDGPRYDEALRAWATGAARVLDRPADVFAAARDREGIYDALIAAGATDFQVHADRRIKVGFVVRDADGRTLVDRRPEAILAERSAALRQLLEERTPAPPEVAGTHPLMGS